MMNNDSNEQEDDSFWDRMGRKPLPLQRILSENILARPKSKLKNDVISPGDKENVDISDLDWAGQDTPLSSTLAVSSSDHLGQMSAENISSIGQLATSSCLYDSGGDLPDKVFKTPKRRESEVHSSPVQPSPGTQRTPSSGGVRTPSTGSSRRKTPSSSQTPSSGSSTRWNPFDTHNSADGLHQPTLSPNVFTTVISPSQDTEASTGRFWSIEQQADMFPTQISDDSPLKQSIYVKHHSKDMENKTQEQIELYFKEHHAVTSPPDLLPTGPLLIESPNLSYSQVEKKTVSTWCQTILTFPPNLPPHVEQILKQYCTFQDPPSQSSFSEDIANNLSNSTLRRKLFNGDMSSDEDASCSSRSSCQSPPGSPLEMMTPGKVIHTPISSRQTWSSSPVRAGGRTTSFSPPDQMGSPMFSPIVKNKQSRLSVRGEETVDSSKEGISSHDNLEKEEVIDITCDEKEERLEVSVQVDLSGELYETAEIDCSQMAVQMDVDSNSGVGWAADADSNQHTDNMIDSNSGNGWAVDVDSNLITNNMIDSNSGTGWAVSTVRDTVSCSKEGEGWAVSTWTVSLPDDTGASPRVDTGHEASSRVDTGYEASSRVDTGYTTQHTASSYNTGTSLATSGQDSGVEHSTGHHRHEQTVSVIIPSQNSTNQGVLISYGHADNSNDISVGFPLGSSTPTKK